MHLLKIDLHNPEKEVVDKLLSVLRSGGIVIFPTDTVYGIGCALSYSGAIDRLFEIKDRPTGKPFAVLAYGLEQVEPLTGVIPRSAKILASRFSPGPLTIIVKGKKEKVPALLLGPGETLGIRVPDEKYLLGVINLMGEPIAATSANFSGAAAPEKFAQIDPRLLEAVDLAIDGGSTRWGAESTVVDCTKPIPEVLREGAVPVREIRRILLKADR